MSEPLTASEIDHILKHVVVSIQVIAFWRTKILRLMDELKKQTYSEDDLIFSDLLDFTRIAKDEAPMSRTYPLDGKELKITIAHRHKAETVFGVDLIYEILNEKISLIQYKKAHEGYVSVDRKQLSKIRDFCYEDCYAKKIEKADWFVQDARLVTFCPCFYYIMNEPGEEIILPACFVEAILDSKKTGRASASIDEFMRGISRDAFIEIFSKCWVGGLNSIKSNVDEMTQVLLRDEHLMIICKEFFS